MGTYYTFSREDYRYDYNFLMSEVHLKLRQFFDVCLDDCDVTVNVRDESEGISVMVHVILPDEEDDDDDGNDEWNGVNPDAPDTSNQYDNTSVMDRLNSELSAL